MDRSVTGDELRRIADRLHNMREEWLRASWAFEATDHRAKQCVANADTCRGFVEQLRVIAGVFDHTSAKTSTNANQQVTP